MNITVSGGKFLYRDITVAYQGTKPLVTGVVYRDANGNGTYDVGEGLPGVNISAGTLGSTAAWDVGGYTLPVSVKKAATISVVASGGSLPSRIVQQVFVAPGANSRLNFAVR
jgi:hypothetical protein